MKNSDFLVEVKTHQKFSNIRVFRALLLFRFFEASLAFNFLGALEELKVLGAFTSGLGLNAFESCLLKEGRTKPHLSFYEFERN